MEDADTNDCKNNSAPDEDGGDEQARRYIAWICLGGANAERGAQGLFNMYAARIKSYFRRRGVKHDDAADLLQETFIRVIRGAKGFRGTSKVSTWLWAIADNTMIDWLRKEGRQPKLSLSLQEENVDGLASPMATADPEHESRALRDCIMQAIELFERTYPALSGAVELGIVEQWSIRDLAAFLGRSEGATKEFISQCRKKLRPFLVPCMALLASD